MDMLVKLSYESLSQLNDMKVNGVINWIEHRETGINNDSPRKNLKYIHSINSEYLDGEHSFTYR